MNDIDQAILDSCDGYAEDDVTSYLPPGYRCTAFWYAQRAGLLTAGDLLAGGEDLDFLKELGLQAARLARWQGIPAQLVPEGPYRVHAWPEAVWSEIADRMAAAAAEHGDWHLEDPPGHGYQEAGDYDEYDAARGRLPA